MHEKDVAAKKEEKSKNAWLFKALQIPRRKKCVKKPEEKGT